MKLQSIETFVTVPPTGIGGSFWVIVKITTDDGIEGIGECYGIPVSADVACRMVEDTFERYIAGEDPHRVETMFRRVYSAGFTQRPDVTMMGVFSGIEIAIWDILGKAAGKPVYQLLGDGSTTVFARIVICIPRASPKMDKVRSTKLTSTMTLTRQPNVHFDM